MPKINTIGRKSESDYRERKCLLHIFSKKKKQISKDIVIGKEIEIPLNQNFGVAMNKSSSYLSDAGN